MLGSFLLIRFLMFSTSEFQLGIEQGNCSRSSFSMATMKDKYRELKIDRRFLEGFGDGIIIRRQKLLHAGNICGIISIFSVCYLFGLNSQIHDGSMEQ